jgi:transglutaminase-like putative cysteine protease
MILRIVHRTTYRYHGSVDMAQHMVHLSPVETPCQRVLSHTLRITPEPAARSQTTDVFGNQRTFFSLQAPHETLSVEADSLVETCKLKPLPETPAWKAQSWERVRNHFRYRVGAPYDAASEFLFASPHVPRDDAFAAFAHPAFAAGLPALAAARALMTRIHTELQYETASTEVNTPALAALAQGKGVCQDFAHIMIGCLRSLGLPARYVSGYLLTQPPPGKPRLIGADASHAWVSSTCPCPPKPARRLPHPPAPGSTMTPPTTAVAGAARAKTMCSWPPGAISPTSRPCAASSRAAPTTASRWPSPWRPRTSWPRWPDAHPVQRPLRVRCAAITRRVPNSADRAPIPRWCGSHSGCPLVLIAHRFRVRAEPVEALTTTLWRHESR